MALVLVLRTPADDVLGFDDDVGLPAAWVVIAVVVVTAVVAGLGWAVA